MTEIDEDELVSDTAALHDVNAGIIAEFRANGGKVGGPFEGGDLLLLRVIPPFELTRASKRIRRAEP